ncbi:NhaP-type Na+/H+ or K+/H+ antiporter [Streptomyces olivoverticillatus]|uniref:NhaP-type Na+/H+ or K+/H+ antiporter n=1 Tax=Streptomyces olivoverticillatus TaxID=66427 RepID=A0A7W7LRY7_9ACTN|nr:hypothetical protein [Streptomyces olivoverticillatus]MBB4894676.1 NhaP-type Na+/H+ or K+/H+ antiporter [Streptomyces olivoverticillatus]
MATSPSSAPIDPAAQKRPLGLGALIAGLWVPLATVAGVVTSWQVEGIDRDWVDRQQAACRHMPFPAMEYLAAWTGPVLGISAVVVCVLLAKWMRRRHGVRIWETKWGLLAYFCVWPNVLTILLELFTLYATYSPIDSGPILGDCRFGGP